MLFSTFLPTAQNFPFCPTVPPLQKKPPFFMPRNTMKCSKMCDQCFNGALFHIMQSYVVFPFAKKTEFYSICVNIERKKKIT